MSERIAYYLFNTKSNSFLNILSSFQVYSIDKWFIYSDKKWGMYLSVGKTMVAVTSAHSSLTWHHLFLILFVCVEVLQSSQPNGVMSSVVSLPSHTFTGQA